MAHYEKKRRQAQAAFKRKKKENQEHRIEIYLSASAYKKMTSTLQHTSITRSAYFNVLIESTREVHRLLEPTPSPSLPESPTLLNSIDQSVLSLEMESLRKDLEKRTFWLERLEQVNKALLARVDELEKQRPPAVSVLDVL